MRDLGIKERTGKRKRNEMMMVRGFSKDGCLKVGEGKSNFEGLDLRSSSSGLKN